MQTMTLWSRLYRHESRLVGMLPNRPELFMRTSQPMTEFRFCPAALPADSHGIRPKPQIAVRCPTLLDSYRRSYKRNTNARFSVPMFAFRNLSVSLFSAGTRTVRQSRRPTAHRGVERSQNGGRRKIGSEADLKLLRFTFTPDRLIMRGNFKDIAKAPSLTHSILRKRQNGLSLTCSANRKGRWESMN